MTENADRAEREQADEGNNPTFENKQRWLAVDFRENPDLVDLEVVMQADIEVRPNIRSAAEPSWQGIHLRPGESVYLKREMIVKITGQAPVPPDSIRSWLDDVKREAEHSGPPTPEEVELAVAAPARIIPADTFDLDDDLGDPTVDLDGERVTFYRSERVEAEVAYAEEHGIPFAFPGTNVHNTGVITEETHELLSDQLTESAKPNQGRLLHIGSPTDPAEPMVSPFVDNYWKRRADEQRREQAQEDEPEPYKVGDRVQIQEIPEIALGGYTGKGYLVHKVRPSDAAEAAAYATLDPAVKSVGEPVSFENPFGDGETPIYNRMMGELMAKRLNARAKFILGIDPATGSAAISVAGRIMALPDDIDQTGPFVD